MCGFAGFFSGAWPADAAPPRLKAMTDAIAHRGPDSDGVIRLVDRLNGDQTASRTSQNLCLCARKP